MSDSSPQAVFADLAAALGVTEPVPLARGGQKFVLRALRDGRPVAVKAMLVAPGPLYAAALERAQRETRVLAVVDSPRLVRLLGELRELRYGGVLPYGVAWVEELLDGTDLDQLTGRRWPPGDVARLLLHLAGALAALHARGIVHRDLNPGNVRRRAEGGYCLMDPGLARFLDEPDPADAHGIGTPGFLSPEHRPGGVVGPPGDVYCLGILLHLALTGQPPAAGLPLPDDVPPALAAIVERCLLAEPDERFADGSALLEEIARHPELLAAARDEDAVPDPPTSLADLGYAACGDQVVELRGGFGVRRVEVASIAKDQEPFAIRLRPGALEVTPGVAFSARTIELGDSRFTNLYELAVDTRRAQVGVHGGAGGFHLPELFQDTAAVAALNGSFSFISDDAAYQPEEYCLDFCARDGVVVSVPTIAKPALVIGRDGAVQLRELAARGTLLIGPRRHDWIGSKADPRPGEERSLLVYGAANCRVEYAAAERVGLLRGVRPETNQTPRGEADVVDLVVTRVDGAHVVKALCPGGGTDLFAGSFILRADAAVLAEVRVGDPVRIASIDGLDCADVASGFSIGPSVAAAARAETEPLAGYDESLGLSPFLPGARYARTLISLADRVLRLRVLDGAPLTQRFQGVSCAEAARLIAADGLDPAHVHHLDGGQSAKLAFRPPGAAPVVFGSMHYLLWPKQGEGEFAWRGHQGRLLHSALIIRARD